MSVNSHNGFLEPIEFIQPERRLFIDTNVFMDTNPQNAGGLKRLFERSSAEIIQHDNPIVVPTKVVDELTKQSRRNLSDLSEERADAVRKAGNALVFLSAAEGRGLIRKDLGDKSNPYADDLFVELFQRAGVRYEMCLLTHDITLRLRIRLLATRMDRRHITGVVNGEGLIEVERDESLLNRGSRKLDRMTRHIEDGLGSDKDRREVAALEPLLREFQQAFSLEAAPSSPGPRRTIPDHRSPVPVGRTVVGAFATAPDMKEPDRILPPTHLPAEGHQVMFTSAQGVGSLNLGEMLGLGGEGRVYSIEGDPTRVVKIFDAEHRTSHREAKLNLLTTHGLLRDGIGFPATVLTNADGAFVGYTMPRASGHELQSTVMRPARFKRRYPDWTKADLVDVCISFLEKVEYLHSLNIILGDINPKNLMVDATKEVWIIDADSWQLEGYPCAVGTQMFTAPTVTGEYADALRTMEEENFAVATMLFMILITGQFPYARAGSDGDIVQLIKEGKFSFQFQKKSDRDQPEGNWKYMWSHLPFKVKRLFWHTFHREGDRYNRRPTAAEWLQVFREYQGFFGSSDDFDPMSNDVYPTRFRAMAADTPIYNCANCDASMTGHWQEEKGVYATPKICVDCRRNQSKCSDCGKHKPAESLKEGRCWDCNRKHNYAPCSNCGSETFHRYLIDGRCSNCQLIACSDCKIPTPKSQLTYGRCATCHQRQATVDGTRLCTRCGQPFITYGNIAWHRRNNRVVPGSHKTGDPTCAAGPPTSRTNASRPGTVTSRPKTPARTSASTGTAKESLWSRFVKWFS